MSTDPPARESPTTVAQVLELELLQRAGVSVVAGEAALHQEVSWVHAGEIEDIAEFLRGSELLLTAGTGIGASSERQAAYIRALADSGASCLVLELGRRFDRVPDAMRETAEAVGLPLATLNDTVPFADVTRTVHGWIIGRQFAMQSRAEHMLLEFNELLLSGGRAAHILAKLSEVTGKPACLEDTSHHLVEYAGAEEALDQLIFEWDRHSRWGHRGSRGRSLEPPDDHGHSCAWASVSLHGEAWGRLHLVGVDGPIDEFDRLAFDRAVSAIGLALLNQQSEQRFVDRARRNLLDQAAHQSPTDQAGFLREARALGVDFRGCTLVAFRVTSDETSVAAAQNTAVRSARSTGLPLLAAEHEETPRWLLGIPEGQDATTAGRTLARTVVQAWPGPAPLTIGISQPMAAVRLAVGFAQAEEALRFARVSHRSGVIEHSSLGLHLLLASLLDRPQLAAFVEAELGPLLEHDARGRARLLPTLVALLRNEWNRADAARELHLERRSIYYRIGRIETVLGYPIDNHDVKLALGVAIRALRLIEDRSVHGRAIKLTSFD